MRKTSSIVWGLILMLLGVLLLLDQLEVPRLETLRQWILPAALLALGVTFHLAYFMAGRTNPGLLVPGGIFVTYAVLFGLCTVLDYAWMGKLYPLFILGPAVGLAEMDLARRAPAQAWQAPIVLAAVSGVLLVINFFDFSLMMLMAVGLIVAGLAVLLPALFRRQDPPET